MKKIYLKTMGCQMNVYDSSRILDALAVLGYQPTEDMLQADILMINTCHIREKASEKVFSELGRMKEIKDKRTEQGLTTWIGLAGCVVQALGEEAFCKVRYLDFAVGSQAYHLLPQIIAKKSRDEGRFIETSFTSDEKFDALPKASARGVSAFLAIQEGCDNFCSYCVVPYTRGCEYSRDIASILKEAHQLVDSGAKEIILLGQNVDCWHGLDEKGNPSHLALLFEKICQIDGLERLRYTTSYPVDITNEVIFAHRNLPKLMPYIHLPIQSGSNAVLKAMNRRYTVEQYLDVVYRLKLARPDIAISSDFIVGFPGETTFDFEQTLKVIDKVQYAQSYSFKYSARAGTPASLMKNQIAEDVKKERLSLLQEKLLRFQKSFNQTFIGKSLNVLFAEQSLGQASGYTPYLQPVHVKTDENLLGALANVEIQRASASSLSGVLKSDSMPLSD